MKGLSAFTPGGPDPIPGWETKILQDVQCGKKKKKGGFHHEQTNVTLINSVMSCELFLLNTFCVLNLASLYIHIYASTENI